MDEEGFLEFLISERMGMHRDAFKEEYHTTEEQAMEAEEAGRAHELLYGQLTGEQRDLLERFEAASNSEIVRENEFYYRAGFRDGVSLDGLIKKIKENNK